MAGYNHVQSASSATWTINHNLNSDSVVIDVMVDNAGDLEKILPQTILHKTANQSEITFSGAQVGNARVVGEFS